MKPEFAGIERRLRRLQQCIQKLEVLGAHPRADFDGDSPLRDIAERNLEVAGQCCIDLANRVIALEGASHPRDNYESLLRMGDLRVVEPKFARRFAAFAGFRNVLVHEYLEIDWERVYGYLADLDDVRAFAAAMRRWLAVRASQQDSG